MPQPGRPLILLCNDDGFFREGIRILHRRLRDLGRTVIVAPDREKSATSLSLTLRSPLRVHRMAPSVYTVDGTPADCIYVALQKVLPRRPDLIISGMNPGPNLGQQDVNYSGTVAAAVQGTFLGIPSLAVSLIPDATGAFALEFAAGVVHELALRLLTDGLPAGVTLNVNIPTPPVKGFRIAKLGQKFYEPEVIEKKDPRGVSYYWVGTGNPLHVGADDTDVKVAYRGFISVTPLHADMTHYEVMARPFLKRLTRPIRMDGRSRD